MSQKRSGDYDIFFDRIIGRGGMGAVYVGRQVSVDRPVAVKVLKAEFTSNEDSIKRFQREAALLARITDSRIVQVYGAGEIDGQHFYAMELVEGQTLAERLRRGPAFTIDETLKIAQAVGEALKAAWKLHIVHRDIKPSNILLTREGQIKVTDFGLAKNLDIELTQSQIILGTVRYMSPEQAQGLPADVRSDLYSLGIVLYELSTGRVPFVGDDLTSVLYQHVHGRPTPPREVNPDLPLGLETLILRLLSKEPAARYADPDGFLADVRSLMDGVTLNERETLLAKTALQKEQGDSAPPSTAPIRTNPIPFALSLMVGLGILGVGGYFVAQLVRQTPPPPHPPVPAPLVVSPPPWEGLVNQGEEAERSNQWIKAEDLYEKARARGAPEMDERIKEVRFQNLFAQAAAAARDLNEGLALDLYGKAKEIRSTPELELSIRRLSFQKHRRAAQEYEKASNWAQAAESWRRAAPLADESQEKDAAESQKFCETWAGAVQARDADRDPRRALELFRELAKSSRGYAGKIQEEIVRTDQELKILEAEAEDLVKREFSDLLDQARRAYRGAAWAEARTLYARAEEERFARLPREEVIRKRKELEVALAAPPGMAYVPAGPFPMGSADGYVDGPRGTAVTKAFYIDAREASAGEYTQFMAFLEGKGHHAGCPKDEPVGKSHMPGDWESQKQKPEGSVREVDWWDAASYAAWRGKRLPSEAEWEKAAGFDLAGPRVYPWGRKYLKEGGPSFFGIHDAGSGVIEWTADWFRAYPWSSAQHFDFGERKKALRGGILLEEDAEWDAQVTRRHWYGPSYRSRRVGFRCVKDAEGE